MQSDTSGPPVCEAADPNPRSPQTALPAGSCDTHFHIFDPAGPSNLDPDRSYSPSMATLDAFNHLQATLGVDRGVVVQPSVYGTDNRTTLEAVANSEGRFRAVVVVDDDCSLELLNQLYESGARGARVNLLFASGAQLANLPRLADQLKELYMHLQFLVDITAMEGLESLVGKLNVPVVFDHMGHFPVRRGVSDAAFQSLLKLLAAGRCWVKLSGAYRCTGLDGMPYADVAPMVTELVKANPEQLLWGSDWPHPQLRVPMPNDGELVDLFANWVDDATVWHRILVQNPARLYGFD